MTDRSPQIESLTWGSVTTELGSFRDAKLRPGGGRGWDWNETGTSHVPGIQPADVAELVDHGARVVVLSRGQQRRLQVMEATVSDLGDLTRQRRGAGGLPSPSTSATQRRASPTQRRRSVSTAALPPGGVTVDPPGAPAEVRRRQG